MSASKEAIEAAAIAMFYQQAGLKPPYPLWEDADSDEKDNCLNDAELALTSAAPAIQAAAIAEALEQLAVSFEATASCASYVGTEDIMETWLNAAQRARKAIEASK